MNGTGNGRVHFMHNGAAGIGPLSHAMGHMHVSPQWSVPKGAKCIKARFVQDVLSASEPVPPGSVSTHTWRVRNDASVAWPTDVILMHVGGDNFGVDTIPVRGQVAPGCEADLSVELTAPMQPGTYEAFYRCKEVGGRRFGQRLSAKLVVADGSGTGSSEDDDVSGQYVTVDTPPDATGDVAMEFTCGEGTENSILPVDISPIPNHVVMPEPAAPVLTPSSNVGALWQYSKELCHLHEMGFHDKATNSMLLTRYHGNVERTVHHLMNMGQ